MIMMLMLLLRAVSAAVTVSTAVAATAAAIAQMFADIPRAVDPFVGRESFGRYAAEQRRARGDSAAHRIFEASRFAGAAGKTFLRIRFPAFRRVTTVAGPPLRSLLPDVGYYRMLLRLMLLLLFRVDAGRRSATILDFVPLRLTVVGLYVKAVLVEASLDPLVEGAQVLGHARSVKVDAVP